MTQGSGTDHGFDNPTTQSERARLLREERSLNTRSALQQVLDPSLSGRFAKEARHDFTVGRDEVVSYPRLPETSPWRQQQPPPEEPFGVDIGYVEPCGTDAEIARAAEIAAAGGRYSSLPSPSGSVADDPPALPGSSAPGPSPLPEVTSPLSSDDSATDPTSSLGVADPPSSGDQDLPSPSILAGAPRKGANAFGLNSYRGAGSLSSITRRFG
jgi:hypothetical protein